MKEIALVTGCTSGIGKATMYKLSWKRDCRCYMLVHLKRGKSLAASDRGKKYSGKVERVLYLNVMKAGNYRIFNHEAYEDAGRIDIFINNAIGGASAAKRYLTVTGDQS